MIKSEQKIRELSLTLSNNDPLIIAGAISALRDNEPFEGAIGLLADCYDRHNSREVNKAIEEFMNDMKDISLRNEVLNEINKEHRPETKAMLIGSCWQSGLDYSSFASEFARIYIKSNYSMAIECFTVIEESIPVLTENDKKGIEKILKDENVVEKAEKKPLTEKLIVSLRD
jgi:predicted DNA-binding protein